MAEIKVLKLALQIAGRGHRSPELGGICLSYLLGETFRTMFGPLLCWFSLSCGKLFSFHWNFSVSFGRFTKFFSAVPLSIKVSFGSHEMNSQPPWRSQAFHPLFFVNNRARKISPRFPAESSSETPSGHGRPRPPKGAGEMVPRENCRKVSKNFLTLFANFWRFLPCAKIVEKCRKICWHFLTIFDVFWRGPFPPAPAASGQGRPSKKLYFRRWGEVNKALSSQ